MHASMHGTAGLSVPAGVHSSITATVLLDLSAKSALGTAETASQIRDIIVTEQERAFVPQQHCWRPATQECSPRGVLPQEAAGPWVAPVLWA